jgi:hypothetical protein
MGMKKPLTVSMYTNEKLWTYTTADKSEYRGDITDT